MGFEWVAIALGDVTWISLAFLFGFAARLVKLPPLVGFLATGFLLSYLGYTSGATLQKLADLGITLLLFIVGLKLNLKMLARPQVWAVTGLHTLIVVILFTAGMFALALFDVSVFAELELDQLLLIAFALSFSSTVFVVKSLEDKGEMKSLHGRIAIGILIMQDIAAVVFLAVSTLEFPSPWGLLLILLIPLRPLFHYFMRTIGHGELFVLYGLVLALGGAELFELAGIKDDLGALVMGVLISAHPKSAEMARSMLGFKDLFLVGFFLTIGMTGQLSIEALVIGIMLVPFVLLKSGLVFWLLTRFKLRARTSLLATLNLSNYSEFGLIVIAIGVASGWINGDWLVIAALAISFSFIVASWLTENDDAIYRSRQKVWLEFQRRERLPDDLLLDTRGATVAVFGMGRVGSGAYDKMREFHGETVVGFDFDSDVVQRHRSMNRNVLLGDPSDADFWDKVANDHGIKLVMLALPNLQSKLDAVSQLQANSYDGWIAATAKYPDEMSKLRDSGVSAVFNFYTEAGAGFADHVETQLKALSDMGTEGRPTTGH